MRFAFTLIVLLNPFLLSNAGFLLFAWRCLPEARGFFLKEVRAVATPNESAKLLHVCTILVIRVDMVRFLKPGQESKI